MKRALIHAPLALVLALLFSVGSGVEALGLTGCSHHGIGEHGGEAAHGASADHEPSPPHEEAPCVCFGVCQMVAALPMVGGAAAIVRVVPTVPTQAADPAQEAPRIVVPHRLPFANAPPLT